MLGRLVSFPVSLAAEGFSAMRECTAVRSFMAFLMLLHFAAEAGSFGTCVALEPASFIAGGGIVLGCRVTVV